MGVVINEFEVIAEPKAANQPTGTAASKATPSAPAAAQDIERIIRYQTERFLRVWAH